MSPARRGHQKFLDAVAQREYDRPLDEVASSTLQGSAGFVAFIKEIGRDFGIGESGVSPMCRRVAEKIKKDKKLKSRIAGIEERIDLSKIETPFSSRLWLVFAGLKT